MIVESHGVGAMLYSITELENYAFVTLNDTNIVKHTSESACHDRQLSQYCH